MDKEKFIDFLIGLNGIEFGAFDLFKRIQNKSIEMLDHIDVNELLNFVKFKSILIKKKTVFNN